MIYRNTEKQAKPAPQDKGVVRGCGFESHSSTSAGPLYHRCRLTCLEDESNLPQHKITKLLQRGNFSVPIRQPCASNCMTLNRCGFFIDFPTCHQSFMSFVQQWRAAKLLYDVSKLLGISLLRCLAYWLTNIFPACLYKHWRSIVHNTYRSTSRQLIMGST